MMSRWPDGRQQPPLADQREAGGQATRVGTEADAAAYPDAQSASRQQAVVE